MGARKSINKRNTLIKHSWPHSITTFEKSNPAYASASFAANEAMTYSSTHTNTSAQKLNKAGDYLHFISAFISVPFIEAR